ncbi:diguanylate cyclase domain-containing protein [Candidatus Methylobacter oryzae]|uniref:diguanylate cyclase n=1 Tax=Candidatus Methylobacter oryzae TaxID=2497749 RepID=A0ABY3C562_9GAMM|nr:diguanylate cyclase [Candidatus Methylobacter oryzae]TRW89950.1 diguanylate cyclase [Candidatus Methylobacter oryzae]
MTDSNEQQPMILIVDDVPSNVQILARQLGTIYQVKVATNGVDALEIAQNNQPDLILLDVMMPDMDGFEVCRRLKANKITQKIAVIFLTGMQTESDEELGLNLGAVDYITKPLALPIIKARIRNHIRLKRQADLLESLSLIDALTYVSNRRRFDEALMLEWKRAIDEGTPLSLIMIDIDHLKEYNQHYGHGAGDVCMQKIVAALAKSLARPNQLIARYSGKEFGILLPGINEQAALSIAQHLREYIEKLALPHVYPEENTIVTISAGVATQQKIPEYFLPKVLNDAALNALYLAKQNGRNRVYAH